MEVSDVRRVKIFFENASLICCIGAIFLHCIPGSRPYLDEPPSISEGWGGRITDYRISVSGWSMHTGCMYVCICRISVSWYWRTCCVQILWTGQRFLPSTPSRKVSQRLSRALHALTLSNVVLDAAISKLEHDTRCWPLVYNDTILYTLKQVSRSHMWWCRCSPTVYLTVHRSWSPCRLW